MVKTNGGIPVFSVDAPEQYNQIPNDTYFHDNYIGVDLYKDIIGNIINPWLAGSTPYTVFTRTVNLQASDILQLNSSPFLLIPAPGVGKFISVNQV